jgi:hypothetical protein
MNRLFGLLSCTIALFLLPMTIELLNDAIGIPGETGAASGAWIFFVLLFLVTISAAWLGIKVIRKSQTLHRSMYRSNW